MPINPLDLKHMVNVRINKISALPRVSVVILDLRDIRATLVSLAVRGAYLAHLDRAADIIGAVVIRIGHPANGTALLDGPELRHLAVNDLRASGLDAIRSPEETGKDDDAQDGLNAKFLQGKIMFQPELGEEEPDDDRDQEKKERHAISSFASEEI